MLWSILIAAIPERYHTAHALLFNLLETQRLATNADVEVLYLMDNRRRSVGAKRNALLFAAAGDYISFIDDDDDVAPDYARKVLAAIKSNPGVDVICFPQQATLQPHGITHECTYSLEHYRGRLPENRRQLAPAHGPDGGVLPTTLNWTGPPAHTMVWRRGLIEGTDPAIIVPLEMGKPFLPCLRFPEKQFGEDVEWVDAACARAKTEVQIVGEPIYFYRFDAEKSATR